MDFDVVVIGASSAGLFAAEILANNGKKVALFEKSDLVDPESRLYIITPGLFRVMPDVNPALVRHKISKIHIQSGSEKTEINLSSPDVIIDRKELLLDLIERAKNAGVHIHTESEFLGFNSNKANPGIKIRTKDAELEIRSKILISADGVNSRIRSECFTDNLLKVPLLQAEIDLPSTWDENTTRVWFNVDSTPYFFWGIPDKNQKAVVGLIAEKGVDIRRLLDDFLADQSLHANTYQSGEAAMHSPGTEIETRIGDIQVFFAGDVAGQVKVTTVGGTVTGLFGGKAAAEAILTGASYCERLKSVQRELDLHYFIRNMLEKMSADDYEKLIRSITPPVLNLLSSHDRDGMRAHFWKLPILQPGFIPLGLKLLLKSLV